jgi:hypothetical protein
MKNVDIRLVAENGRKKLFELRTSLWIEVDFFCPSMEVSCSLSYFTPQRELSCVHSSHVTDIKQLYLILQGGMLHLFLQANTFRYMRRQSIDNGPSPA